MDTLPVEQSRSKTAPLRNVLGDREFRLLWIGEAISLVGDQFLLIALPWLVLQMTGDAFAVGTVLAAASIPRALFMLVGGAFTDRFSPRDIMLGSNIARMLLVACLAFIVFSGSIQVWMLYVFALLFGVADAFFFPAKGAIVPQLIDKEHLQVGNSIIQGTAQLSQFLGPVLAGVLIALLGGQMIGSDSQAEASPDTRGIAFVLALDSLTFLASVATLSMMKVSIPRKEQENGSVVSSIREGISAAWNDKIMRIIFVLIAAVNMLILGPIFVGVPVLADTRLPEGAAAFGILVSAFGGGSLLGMAMAGVLPKPGPRRLGPIMLIVTGMLGVGLALLGLIYSTTLAAIIGLMMGISYGYVLILFVTWLQSRTPQAMLGRMMSLLMFASMGLVPISMALAGALIEFSLTLTLVGMGILMALLALIAALNPAVRAMGVEKAPASVEALDPSS